jgi:hypothetical protein
MENVNEALPKNLGRNTHPATYNGCAMNGAAVCRCEIIKVLANDSIRRGRTHIYIAIRRQKVGKYEAFADNARAGLRQPGRLLQAFDGRNVDP